jgi:REP element-mobilizing transposase RayT
MGRPLRQQPSPGIVHVTSRGVRRAPIFVDDHDRRVFMAFLAQATYRRDWMCLAYCLMTNHFHLVLSLRDETLSRGMHRLNSVFARRFNARYGHVGHVFEARFSSVVVESEAHLLGVLRYVVNNPVRAGMCADPADWPWSSFRATAGIDRCPRFLAAQRVRALFGRGARGAEHYAEFVREQSGTVAAT